MAKKNISFYHTELTKIPIIIIGDISFESLREHAFIGYNFINISFGIKKNLYLIERNFLAFFHHSSRL